MVSVSLFDWHSGRARRARRGHALSHWMIVFAVFAVVLPLIGVALLFVGMSAGWLAFACAAPCFMLAKWYRYDLKSPVWDIKTESVDAWLDADILALLPEQPSPKAIADVVDSTRGGNFFAARFALVSGHMRDLLSEDKAQTEEIWSASLVIAREIGEQRISAGVIILAIVRQLPEKVRLTLLGHLQLEESDILRGIRWYHYLDGADERERKRRMSDGGIGRDWSFGWIPYLSRFGMNISKQGSRSRSGIRGEAPQQLLSSLGNGGGAIALVGKSGVGKTELVYELADKLMHPDETVPKNLRYQQIFLLSASRLISAANDGANVGDLLETLLGEAYAAKNVIVCLDNAELFFEQGVGSVDVSSVLLPIFKAGRVPIILTLDEQKYLQVSKRNPELVASLRRIVVPEPEFDEVMVILEEKIPLVEYKHKVTVMYQAMKEAYKLGKRYVYDISMPGQAVSLVESAAEYAEERLVTSRSVARAIEGTTGIKTASADTNDEKEVLLNLEGLLHERMVGQEKAVRVVADALRRARAGVRNQNRPVGTFLFLGPTGVGKTELAKSLSEVYFGGEDTIIRLDMNEFVLAEDVSRLIADGAENPHSLTAQVMKQPFSVVLLDEIEKAHSSVLSTLLQLLDEGMLRDERNREVSFRDTIVIATSNAGSDRIQEYINRGYAIDQFEEQFIHELIGGHVFAPEFLNRFDETTVFAPLKKEQLFAVVDKIMKGVNKALEPQNISVNVLPDAKEYLVEAGYDPRLGARPIRRVVQRAVESTVATMLLSEQLRPGDTLDLTLGMVQKVIDVKQQADAIIESVQ